MVNGRPMKKALLILTCGVFLAGAAGFAYPATPKHPVVNTYWGKRIVDQYRWLEDASAPATQAWAASQTRLAERFITSRPSYAFYRKRVAALSMTSTRRSELSIAGGHEIYLRLTPPQPQPQLIARDGLGAPERVLFDPASAGTSPPPAVESIFVSPDGSRVAFTTQSGGSEEETLYVVDVATGNMLPDIIPHVGGGTSPTNVMWDGDGQGFVHTLWPVDGQDQYAKSGILLYHHALGTDPSTDAYVFGKGLSPRAEYSGLLTSRDGKEQALVVTAGDGVHASVYMRPTGGRFAKVADPSDAVGDSGSSDSAFVGDSLYVISKKGGSRGEVVAIAPGKTFANGRVIVPASSLVIEGIRPVKGGFITSDIDGGDSGARYFGREGTLRARIPVPPISRITALAGDPLAGPIIIGYMTYTKPNRWMRYDPATNTLKPTAIAERAPGDYSQVVAERAFVPSLDGKARIPLEIVHMKNIARNGTAPTILTAYGAYGLISSPEFLGSELAWLQHGGVFAQAMIRGGGEYGEAWHQAARLGTKTVSSDDLAACAAWLGAHGYGNAQHIGIEGASAGGFLMGLALTRNPQQYRAVAAHVGIYDLLRVELTPNGKYNTPEFGTVRDPAQFKWMLRQSPYHNVVPGRAYPAVLMTTGENDPRVDPYMSRKMVARLQAASSSPYPILLLQRSGQGHGIGSSFSQRVQNTVDTLTFFESQLR